MRRLDTAFGPDYVLTEFPNEQVFDYAGLEGRLLSSSYAPPAGHPDHVSILAELRALFEQHATASPTARSSTSVGCEGAAGGGKGATVFSPEYRRVIDATPEIRYKTSLLTWIFLGLIVLVVLLLIAAATNLRG